MDKGDNKAFRRLINYISGGNNQQEEGGSVKVPMTAPVFMSKEPDQSMMSFFLPRSYTLKNAPIPKKPDIKLHEVLDYTVAVITFN